MSQKDIEALRQKIFYIDTSVNTFFNKTIINIQKSLNDLNIRIVQLEDYNKNMIKETDNDATDATENNANLPDIKEKKTDKKKSKNTTNQIRTISLQ